MKKILINKTPGDWKNEIGAALIHVYNNGDVINTCSITLERDSEIICYVLGYGPIKRDIPDITIDSNLRAVGQSIDAGHMPIQGITRFPVPILPNDKIYLNCPDEHEF